MNNVSVVEFNDLPVSLLGQVYAIYSNSFPPHEQRSAEQLAVALENNKHHFRVYLMNDKVLAILVYWKMREYVYIEHFAVAEDQRGHGYGKNILQELFYEMAKYPLILEIDPITTDVSKKRCEFYTQLGFVINNCPHKHPAYQEGLEPHELIILSYQKELTPTLLKTFIKELNNEVMNI